ncbi:MAG: hypothetical protein IVW57_00105 [Ktedonobacterales bacterium]|nr:hypothetical protein [Ktedonobacterales bacterium]
MTTPPIAPVPGDILLFSGSNWDDRIIQRVTNGPYTHSAIVTGPQEMVEAAGHGVRRVPLRTDYAAILATGATLEPARLAYALGFLSRRVGSGYGFLDLAADAVKAILPGTRTPFLVQPSRYDCSHLCTLALIVAGAQWLPDAFYTAPQLVSPNDLAHALGPCLHSVAAIATTAGAIAA